MVEQERWPLSATQIETFRLCRRKWAWNYIDGVTGEPNKFAGMGVLVHQVLAAWLAEGKAPDPDTEEGRVATAALKHLPQPGPDLFIEQYLELNREAALYRGYSDLIYKGSDGVPVVHDHKTTLDFKWAKTEDELRNDVQAPLYAMAAMEAFDSQEVELRWAYLRTRGKPASKLIKIRLTKAEAEKAMVAIDATAVDIYAAYLAQKPARETEFNPGACDMFGGCAYRELCNLSPIERIKSLMEKETLAEKMKRRKEEQKKVDVAPINAPEAPPESLPEPVRTAPAIVRDIKPSNGAVTAGNLELVKRIDLLETDVRFLKNIVTKLLST